MTNKRKNVLIIFLVIFLLAFTACNNQESAKIDNDDGEDNPSSILGGSLADFESFDSNENEIDEDVFSEADVNLIFVWQSG